MEQQARAAHAHRTVAGIHCVIAVMAAIFAYLMTRQAPLLGALALAAPFAVLAAVHFAVASGAEQCRSWARTASTVLGVMMLPLIPLGTAIGLYLLYNTRGEWVHRQRLSDSLGEGWPQLQRDSA
ncbi:MULTISPECIES: hypothetical protein [unclassified Lysobacter]|uniref:hypothetical protein n=1 Tax=unclassified Lysobacter TaxID=2635362 RepID=UPI001C23CC63|nr:hypothetical protein [Lysobacter sp. MMG2]MBU8975378.1 hypothetical protein [Lysobacter sp. MMG2]